MTHTLDTPVPANPAPASGAGETWKRPGERTLLALRQRSLSKLWIDNLLQTYLFERQPDERSDSDFLRYCLIHARAVTSIRDRRSMSDGWSPSDSTVAALNATGLSPSLVLSLAERFGRSAASIGIAGSRDLTFRDYALREFERMRADGRLSERGGETLNRWETMPTVMPLPKGWIPVRQTVEQLMREGVPMDFIEYLVPTFRLYWHERGEARDGWDRTFIAHVRHRWQEQPKPAVSEA